VKYFMKMIGAVRDLGAVTEFRLAKKIEGLVYAAGDSGMLRREIYSRVRISKKQLDEALELLLDKETIFVDNSQVDRTGRYVHVQSPLGQQLAQQVREQAQQEAELRNLGVAARPRWHRPS